MASVGDNQWLVNFDDNTSLTLKFNQIRMSSHSKTEDIHEPIHEDETQHSTSFSKKKNQIKKNVI